MPYKTGIRLLGVARNPANGFPARLLGSGFDDSRGLFPVLMIPGADIHDVGVELVKPPECPGISVPCRSIYSPILRFMEDFDILSLFCIIVIHLLLTI